MLSNFSAILFFLGVIAASSVVAQSVRGTKTLIRRESVIGPLMMLSAAITASVDLDNLDLFTGLMIVGLVSSYIFGSLSAMVWSFVDPGEYRPY